MNTGTPTRHSHAVTIVLAFTSCILAVAVGWGLLAAWRFCVAQTVTLVPWYGLVLAVTIGTGLLFHCAPVVSRRVRAHRHTLLPACILLAVILAALVGFAGVRDANWVEYVDKRNEDWPFWRVNRVTREYDDYSSPPTHIDTDFRTYDRAHRQFRVR